MPALLIASLVVRASSLASAQDRPPDPFGPGASDPDDSPGDGPGGPVFVTEDPVCASPCPAGTTCSQGRCVSLCNPPCDPETVCAGPGQCVVQHGQEVAGAWSTTPLVLTGISAAVTLAGVFIARSGSSVLRRDGGATGVGFFRVMTFVFMGFALLTDIVSIYLSASIDTDSFEIGHLVGGVAGALALVSAGTDSLIAGAQQDEIYRARQAQQAARWIPRLGRMRDASGHGVPAIGWGGVF